MIAVKVRPSVRKSRSTCFFSFAGAKATARRRYSGNESVQLKASVMRSALKVGNW
jgi:hypothetical protein